MSGSLGDLVIALSADIARFESDMGRAALIADRQAAAIQKSFTLIKGVVATVAASAVLDYVKGLVDSAEATNRLAERTGYSVGFLSELGFAMQRGNVASEAWTKGLEKFNVSLVEATNSGSKTSQIFKLLGVDISKGPTEALKQFADRASAIDDAATKTAVFRAVMGKTGDELIPVFKNLEDATAAAKRLGVTMSDETARSADELNAALTSLSAQSKALVLQALTPMISGFAAMATNVEKAAERGEKWTQVFREAVKLGASWIAVLGKLPGPFRAFSLVDTDAIKGAFSPQGSAFDETIANFTGNKPVAKKPPSSRALNSVLSGDATKAAAELKMYQSALQGLEEKLGKLNGQSEVESLLTKLVDGSLKGLTVTHQRHLMQIAYEVDARKFLLEGLADEESRRKAAYDRMQRGIDIQNAAIQANADERAQRQFDIDLIGKTAMQQEALNALRQIDLKLQQDLRAAAANAGADWEQYARDYVKLTEAAKEHSAAMLDLIYQRIAAERSWETGAKAAFDDYIAHATNAAETARNLFTHAFQSMEDAMVNFVKTGKLDFKSLADSIITDLIRIQVRQSMTAAIGSSTGGVGGAIVSGLGKLFGMGGSGGVSAEDSDLAQFGIPSFDVGTDYVRQTGLALVHQGEKITPAGQSGGGINFYNTYQIGSNVSRAEVMQAVEQGNAQVRQQIAQDIGSNGPLRQQIRATA